MVGNCSDDAAAINDLEGRKKTNDLGLNPDFDAVVAQETLKFGNRSECCGAPRGSTELRNVRCDVDARRVRT
jgi:hypothetical protein